MKGEMIALLIEQVGEMRPGIEPLKLSKVTIPVPGNHDVLLRVICCGVCHTELDEIEGRLSPPNLPCIPGHQVVGEVVDCGEKVRELAIGDRVGVAWIFSSCGECAHCRAGNDNLCPSFQATGKDVNGGYAEYMTVPEQYAYRLPNELDDVQAAPLLCAGAIGYRSLRLTELKDGQNIGLTGFGSSAQLMMRMIEHLFPRSKVFIFARQEVERKLAMDLGAVWSGDTGDKPPEQCHAIVDTTPAWNPIVKALGCLHPGGRLVINAIRKESRDQEVLQSLSYEEHLWQEKEVKSVANVSRLDVKDFLELAADINIQPKVKVYPLEKANEALLSLRFEAVESSKVLLCT